MALKEAVAARREAVTAMVESKVRVSVSNPRVERAVRKWRGQFRILKGHLESKIGKRIPPTHAMVPWLVNWAGEVIHKYKLRDDGRTAYEMMTKHRVKHLVIGFGEKIQFLLAKDNTANKYEGRMARLILRRSDFKVLRMLGHQGQRSLQIPHCEETNVR